MVAAMLDTNGDARADGVRVMYSERIRHAWIATGKYPFTVADTGFARSA
jgi:hypothetical protein